MKLYSQLKDIQKKRHQCKFFIKTEIEEYTLHGYVLDMNKEFSYIREVIDFTVDGYRIFKLKNLDKVRYGKFDKISSKINDKEGLIPEIYSYEKINLESYQTIFKAIKKVYNFSIIENTYKNELAFNIGQITRVNKSSVSQLYFDATGKVDKNVTSIPYTDIIIIGFDNHYINVFQKYLR